MKSSIAVEDDTGSSFGTESMVVNSGKDVAESDGGPACKLIANQGTTDYGKMAEDSMVDNEGSSSNAKGSASTSCTIALALSPNCTTDGDGAECEDGAGHGRVSSADQVDLSALASALGDLYRAADISLAPDQLLSLAADCRAHGNSAAKAVALLEQAVQLALRNGKEVDMIFAIEAIGDLRPPLVPRNEALRIMSLFPGYQEQHDDGLGRFHYASTNQFMDAFGATASIGDKVRIFGLQKNTSLSGSMGIITSFISAEKCSVSLDSKIEAVAIKLANVEIVC